MEHVDSLRRYSRFRVWNVNTELGMPPGLWQLRFDAVVLHYTIFATVPYQLDEDFARYLSDACQESYKVAVVQDEFRFCGRRFAFLDSHEINCVYSCLEPEHLAAVYGRYTNVQTLKSNIPGYVGEDLLRAAHRFSMPEAQRTIDVGYRGRPIPAYGGRGSQEKTEIAIRFLERAEGLNLTLDIACGEEDRIYGDDWYRFLAGCRAALGTESGVDVFDLEDQICREYERLAADGREVTVEELEQGSLPRWEGRIPYRTIAPRHFEAAAMGVCQILYEGRYSGAMEPMVHYIPLKKDFSNFDEVIERFRDRDIRQKLSSNARRDLIESGAYSYESFVRDFDVTLTDAGLEPRAAPPDEAEVDAVLRQGRSTRLLLSYARDVHNRVRGTDFPGKDWVRPLVRPALRRVDRLRRSRPL
jgi:hypothetical protein